MDYLWDSVYSSAVLVQTYQPFYPRIWALFDRSIFPMRGIEVERQRKREEGRDKEWWWEKHRFVKSEELRYRNYCNAGLQETCMRFQARLTRLYTGPLKRPSTGPSHRTLRRTLHRSSHRPLQRPLHGMGVRVQWFFDFQNETHTVVPNCCRTPIPKFHVFMLPLSLGAKPQKIRGVTLKWGETNFSFHIF